MYLSMTDAGNPGCAGCDYLKACRKTMTLDDGSTILAKQSTLTMPCQNVVQSICRDCTLFHQQRCAAWKVLNGKEAKHNLANCPKKRKGDYK